ncbi:MAG: glycosyltransferase family 4 protein [Syntrophorhabdaceae bacterium]|nr:glycosyltransferase family 4 protein [Syntrophorhabdaceae bacterium]
MKVLQLFSDWKWTGPAEPVVSLCEHLLIEGVDVELAMRRAPQDFPERTVEKEAKKRGITLTYRFRMNRYFSLRDWLYDLRAIRRYVDEKNIDIIHTNLSHDHFLALFSLSFSKKRPLIIRTDHKRDGMPINTSMAWAMRRTDGLVTYSTGIMEQDIKGFSFPRERTCVISPGVKPYTGEIKDIRPSLGIKREDKVVGVIGRLKPDRGYDTILKAFKILSGRVQGVKLLIMGRSSQIEKSILKPLVELGIEEDVILAGYRIEDYFSVIATFDIYVMMRAGSDGTARALREVMAMGKPAIVSRTGMLPELVQDGITGYVVNQDESSLASKMEELLTDNEKRALFGERARIYAKERWSYISQAKEIKAFYERLLSRRG